MTNLDNILKRKDITSPIKIRLVKTMVFPVAMYRCESWTTKNAEHWRINAFELWCWRRPSRVHWTARKSNQSILKKINPEYSLEGWCWSWNSNTLATWCEELTHWKRPWCWERLKAKEEGNRGWDSGWHHCLSGDTNFGRSWRTGKPGTLTPLGHKESDMTQQLKNNNCYLIQLFSAKLCTTC